ncbi:putative oxidoreductase [Nymphon striatum]|nr:putative oxidoreductase [Nymphon striatum]
MARVAFIGLGVMGYPMAGHIAKAGHEVSVYNRTTAKAEQWVKEFGGSFGKTPAEAAKDCEYVFCCVGNDDDLRSVTLGKDGAFETVAEGAGVHRQHNSISGGQAGAENGVLTVMIGGDEAVYEKAKLVIDCYARMVGLMGPAGSLNIEAVMGVISKGAAQSWQMENRWQTMDAGEYEHGFAVDWMRKDLSICLNEARQNGANLPVTALVDQFYSEVQKMGGNRWDTSSLLARLKNAG